MDGSLNNWVLHPWNALNFFAGSRVYSIDPPNSGHRLLSMDGTSFFAPPGITITTPPRYNRPLLGWVPHAYLDQQNSTMHHTNFNSILKSTIALGSMLGISSLIGVQALPIISPESNVRPQPSSPLSNGRPQPLSPVSNGRPQPLSPVSNGRPRPFFPESIAFNQPPADPTTETAAEPVATPDSQSPLPPQNISPDLENDPVFQEIKKAFMPGANKQSQRVEERSNAVASIPDAQWHAVEHLLQAARELETVERLHLQNRDSSQAIKSREWIQQIRSTASQLIQSP
jgi:hypothetical protein